MSYLKDLFAARAEEMPDDIAVIFGDKKITYLELHKRSDAFAQEILRRFPASTLCAISATRCIEMVIGMLAILKADKAYLPLDISYPPGRLAQIVSGSGINCCLCSAEEQAYFDALRLQTLCFDQPRRLDEGPPTAGDGCAGYVLYTSGSTGQPKGVHMREAALVNLLLWQKKHSLAGRGTRTLQFAPLGFDVSFQEICATLFTGGMLVLMDDDLRLDPQNLLYFIESQSINRIFLPFVALQYLTEAAKTLACFPSSLKEVMTAGEQLKITSQVSHFFSALPQCILYNQYGPTETHVVTQLKLTGSPADWPSLPSIGSPIDHTDILILNENLQELPQGTEGELCLAGKCLAEGYLNDPRLTGEKFISWHHPVKGPIRVYRTGDLARVLPDGNIEFLGRKDDQVKIRGYRIEPGEIETLLGSQDGLQQAVVLAREDIPGEKKLVAYLVSSNDKKDTRAVRQAIARHLPDYMMPSAFIWLEGLPFTSSGKIDRKALPEPGAARPDLSTPYQAPRTDLEKIIAGVWISLLGCDQVGTDDSFFELGGNSLLALKVVADLKSGHQLNLPVTILYQFPTVAGLAEWLGGSKKVSRKAVGRTNSHQEAKNIAVIGMAGRFPGAGSIPELWELLKEGRETISFFREEELSPFIPEEVRKDPSYVRARGVIGEPAAFDAAFFHIQPRLAQLMDPQQRVFLEIAWEALEGAGYAPGRSEESVGVFAGTGNNTYYVNNVSPHRELIAEAGAFNVMTANEKDYVASRTAYALNLKGPAVSVYSACSTSLVAIAQAVESLRSGQCELALAGGVSITVPVNSGHIYQDGAMLSNDGHCRPFDDQARGTVFSDGAGIVLLKRLEDAQKDGDTIYAVIKGVGINNDGGKKGSFSAPSAEGQAGAIRMAIEDAAMDPSSITYIEAHGTATPLGDPIEIEGLRLAFGKQDKRQYCALGSVKSNMGHLTAAAGVAGFIKTVLSLYHRQLVPTVHFKTPNPNIDLGGSPFYVNTELKDWVAADKRRAGVSSFGVGGTNAHVLLEEFEQAEHPTSPGRPVQLICWSAATSSSREAYGKKMVDFLQSGQDIDLADMAFTLQTARASFSARKFVLATNKQELAEKLRPSPVSPAECSELKEIPGEVIFMFPGQGSQYINMGLDLYDHEPVFKAAVDECAEILQSYMQEDIRKVIYPLTLEKTAEERIDQTYHTQPALFVIEYALATLWMSWGLKPTAFMGHSIGEFVAAHLAGIFSLADGLRLIAARGRMMSELPRGSMLAVRAEYEKIRPLLPDDLSLAAINSPGSCVVAGPCESVASCLSRLSENHISHKLLVTSHAFHSSMMDLIVRPFEEMVCSISLSPPQVPVVSTVTGRWLTDAEAVSPSYWAGHLRSTVRFADAVALLLENEERIFLEIGPRNVTSSLVRQQAKKPIRAFSTLEKIDGQSEYHPLTKAIGLLWLHGIPINWQAYYHGEQRRKIPLPTYAFDKNRFWMEPVVTVDSSGPGPKLNGHDRGPLPGNSEPTRDPSANERTQKNVLIQKIKGVLENASGLSLEEMPLEMSFIEMGFDSLLLTQVALNLKKEYQVPITFRQLHEDCGNLETLTGYIADHLPPAYPIDSVQQLVQRSSLSPGVDTGLSLGLLSERIDWLAGEIARMQGQQGADGQPLSRPPAVQEPKKQSRPDDPATEMTELKKPFGATAKIERQSARLSAEQRAFVEALTQRYCKKTQASKQYAEQYRSHMADPRVVSGFRPATKELVYSIVVNRSAGSRLWDLDGNEYIDALNGFGSNFFGYQPRFITDAIKKQIDKGYEIGPQHELAGQVCRLICEFTGLDRAALCNTGSEAVLGAMRIARTVTGRSTIVAFTGSYHGITDEVIVRGNKKLKSFPAASGIMPEAVQNMLILEYGTPESLEIIRSKAHELAAILVEPVQSRRPEFQPVEFLKELRNLTRSTGIALIFDEVITGFRMHPAGAQGLFGIQADLATYGKVIGAGMPIGVIAGARLFMDALDGGAWEYGDDSVPQSGVTYFAGTFVRHPLALAACKASLEYMKKKGPSLQEEINGRTAKLAGALNAICDQEGLPFFAAHFGSLWKIKSKKEIPYIELLFVGMREKGIHILDGFPCFLTELHRGEEVDSMIRAFRESALEMKDAGFFLSDLQTWEVHPLVGNELQQQPPEEGARWGKDRQGNPAWFIADPSRPGKYLQLT